MFIFCVLTRSTYLSIQLLRSGFFFSLEALSFDSLVTFFSHVVTAGPVFYVPFSIILPQNTLLEIMSAEKKPTKHKAHIYSM